MPEETIAPKQDELAVIIPQVSELKQKSLEYIPKLKRANEVSVQSMTEWLAGGELQDEQERDDLNTYLVEIRERGQKMKAMRMQLTKPLDDAVSTLIALEKPLTDDKGSLYSQLRALITKFDQDKLEKKQRIEREAQERKAKDNARIEIKAQIIKNLTGYATAKAKNAETWSKTYFETSTLENWDQRADEYKKMKPNMKREDYDNMFMINYADKLQAAKFTENGERNTWLDELKKVETYEKWNKEVFDACAPVLNEWRAKIPDMKADRIRINNIKDENDRQQALADQRAKDEAETQRRNSEIEQQAVSKSLQVDSNAQLDLLENAFTEQATVQGTDDVGPTKLVLKFDDIPRAYQPFVTIIYHVMAAKKFEGIQKRHPKLGTPVVDEKGQAEYIPAVQWWIDQFLKLTNADVPGTTVKQVAKTIVRK